MVDEAEKLRLRQQGMAERDIQEIEDYVANITMFLNRLHRPQRDPEEAETTRWLLRRFQWFARADFDNLGACLDALDEILRDTLAHLLKNDFQESLPTPPRCRN